jgi:hypothetical protein
VPACTPVEQAAETRVGVHRRHAAPVDRAVTPATGTASSPRARRASKGSARASMRPR